MKFNYKKFFEIANSKEISPSEVNIRESTSFSASVFNHEIDSYSIASSTSISARGIYKDKIGTSSCNVLDKEIYDFLTDKIIDAATIVEKTDSSIIFEGSKKYKKVKTYNKDFSNVTKEEKLKLIFEIENKLYEYDPRIKNVEVSFEDTEGSRLMYNSYGLKLSAKTNYFVIIASVTAGEGNDVVSEYDVFVDNVYSNFDCEKFVNNLGKRAISKLNPIQVKSGKYKVLLNQDSAGTLLSAFLDSISSEEIQKGSSLLKDKLNQQVASKCITVYEKPILNTPFGNSFDDEGVATYNKTLLDKGTLKTYLYNLSTAKKDNVESTGNGYSVGSKIGIGMSNIILKSGRSSFDQVVSSIKKGVYITNIQGLHAGLNAQSGQFNLQSQGYLIEDGKITSPLSLIVISGNLFDLFMNVSKVCNDTKDLIGKYVPSILIKKLNVSGK